MQTESKNSSRPWIYGAVFVWTMVGVVAFAAFSGKDGAPARLSAQTAPATQSAPETAQKAPEPALPTPATIAWESNFEKAMQRAKAENKPVMIDFYTDWCGACKFLDKEIFTAPDVRAESTKWISVKVNAEERRDIAGSYGVTGYPTIIFATPEGKPLDIQSGAPQISSFFTQWMQNARSKFLGEAI